MVNMNKIIILNDGSILKYFITEGYTRYIEITRSYMIDGMIKNLSFAIWDDMVLKGYTNDAISNSLVFSFDIHDPFYYCFSKFLGTDKKFIIEDDDADIFHSKYLTIQKEDYHIQIIFQNDRFYEESEEYFSKFRFFIKNIGPDPRSKIDNYNNKIRIIQLFKNLEETILEEYHQITIDEYLEKLNYYHDQQKIKQKR